MPEAKRIDIGDLTEAVTVAVQRAIATHKLAANNPFRNPRIICGLIIEPQNLPGQFKSGGG
jgi:hypothetical protein